MSTLAYPIVYQKGASQNFEMRLNYHSLYYFTLTTFAATAFRFLLLVLEMTIVLFAL